MMMLNQRLTNKFTTTERCTTVSKTVLSLQGLVLPQAAANDSALQLFRQQLASLAQGTLSEDPNFNIHQSANVVTDRNTDVSKRQRATQLFSLGVTSLGKVTSKIHDHFTEGFDEEFNNCTEDELITIDPHIPDRYLVTFNQNAAIHNQRLMTLESDVANLVEDRTDDLVATWKTACDAFIRELGAEKTPELLDDFIGDDFSCLPQDQQDHYYDKYVHNYYKILTNHVRKLKESIDPDLPNFMKEIYMHHHRINSSKESSIEGVSESTLTQECLPILESDLEIYNDAIALIPVSKNRSYLEANKLKIMAQYKASASMLVDYSGKKPRKESPSFWINAMKHHIRVWRRSFTKLTTEQQLCKDQLDDLRVFLASSQRNKTKRMNTFNQRELPSYYNKNGPVDEEVLMQHEKEDLVTKL